MEYVDGTQPAPPPRRARRADRRRRAADRRARARRPGRRAPRRPRAPRHQARERAARHRRPRQARRLRPGARGHRGDLDDDRDRARHGRLPRARARHPRASATRAPTSTPAGSCCSRCSPAGSRSPARRRSRWRSSTSTTTSRRRRSSSTGCPSRSTSSSRALAARDPDDRPVDAGRRARRCCAARAPRSTTRRSPGAPTSRPSIVLPAATDPDETDLDADDGRRRDDDVAPGLDDVDADPDETTRLDVADARGTHGRPAHRPRASRADGARPARRPAPAGSATAAPLDRRCSSLARRARRRRRLVVPAAGPGAYTTVPDDRRAGRRGRRPRSSREPASTATRRRAFDADGARRHGRSRPTRRQGEPDPQGRHGRVHRVQGPRLRRRARTGVVGEHAGRRARPPSTAAGLDVDLRASRSTATTVGLGDGHQRDAARRHARRARRADRSADTTVTLTLSDGPAPGHDHLGRRHERRRRDRRARRRDSLKLAPTEAFSDTVAAGLVIDQDPAAGAAGPPRRHRHDQRVQGPGASRCPDVVSKQFDDAKAALEALGFDGRSARTSLGGFFGTVRDQSAAGGDGKPRRRARTITLTVV